MSKVTHDDIKAFAEKRVNLPSETAKEYREQVNRLRDKLTDYINAHPDYGLVKMLHSGSVMKGTALRTLNDMDVAIYLEKAVDVDEKELLTWLLARMKEAYPTLQPDQFNCPSGGHCVTISFRGSGLDVDVVPVLYEGDEDDYGYLMTQDMGTRVLTCIPRHLEFIRARKNTQPTHYAQVVRLIKWWVKQQKKDDSFRFKSLMVELMCAHLMSQGLDMSDYPTAMRKFFGYIIKHELKERIFFTDYYEEKLLPEPADPIEIFDPVNPGNNVCLGYTDSDRERIIEAAQNAYDAITYADHAETKEEAVGAWQDVLGRSFNP